MAWHLSSGRVDEYLGKPGSAQADGAGDQATDTQLVAWLSEQESKYRHLVYEADPPPPPGASAVCARPTIS